MKYILTLFAACLLLTIIWFHGGNILGGGDAGLVFYSPSLSLNLSKITWIEFGTGLSTISWLSTVSLLYFYSLWEKIGIPTFLLQASYFFIVMFTGALSVHILSDFFLKGKNQLISLVAAIFYLFNPFTMSQIWARGQLAQQASFALLPLAILLFVLGVKRKSFIFVIFIVVASLFFSIAFSYLTFIIVFWLILLICLLFNRSVFGVIFFLTTFFLWVIAHAWWFIPLFSSAGSVYTVGISGSEENLGTLLGVSRNFTPEVLIRLLQRTYFFDPSAFSTIYSTLIFQLISILAPIFLLIGFIKVVKNKGTEFKFFAVLLILGLIVSLGANPPFGPIFVMIFKQFPVLQAFRNPFEKFGLVYALGYSAIFAYGLVLHFTNKKYKYLGIATVLLLICGIFAWPMWTGRVVAGPDKKIGISVPTEYKDLQGWLDLNNEDYRVFMTPLWSGDGAFYKWGEGIYQGSDPMYGILSHPVISNIHVAPFYTEYVQDIRKYMERINLAPALALLRVKYIVDREDAIEITGREKDHRKFLTESIYPLSEDLSRQKICQNMYADSSANGIAWITCPIPEGEGDLSKARYLIIDIKTDVPAFLDITIRDKNKITNGWDGRAEEEYRTSDGNFTKIILPLSAPTSYNSSIDYRNIEQIEVQARQEKSKDKSVREISLREITIDPGKEEKINTFQHIKTFGNLKVYEPLKFNAPLEFGVLSSLERVYGVVELFNVVNKDLEQIDKKGFILISHNPDKNLQDLPSNTDIEVIDKKRISNTRYWLKTSVGSQGLVLLSKTFSPAWKLIPDVTLKDLSGDLFTNLALLNRKPLVEDDHYVVNGYGNLWKTDGSSSEYAIIYMPQLMADIGMGITKLSLILISGISVVILIKRYVKNKS